MYPVSLIAKYIIHYSASQSKTVSNLRLQKILYFVQAEFLVSKKEPCFEEELYAWNFGPVVPCVYHEYKVYGGASIPPPDNEVFYHISSDDRQLINEIVDQCNRYSTSFLVQLTHNQEPWKKAFNYSVDHVISKSSIRNFFNED